MQISNIIAAAIQNYTPERNHFEVIEWDRVSPINDVPAAEILASMDPPDARTILLRVIPLDVVLYRQNVHPRTNTPILTDVDAAWVRAWAEAELVPALLADPGKFKNGLHAALGKRLMQGLEAERTP